MKSLDRINIPYRNPHISTLKMGSLAFCELILENCQVLLYPGATYGIDFDKYLRITFLQNESMLEEAMD